MSSDTQQRAHSLVEELRAEVDFEIDDVIANIIRNLPEEYFASLAHQDQLTHLKALLAMRICNLKRELTLHSEDGRHIAVVARDNYPGLLAKIVTKLPDTQPLIGAKIFTSITHDFIIDLFEFRQEASQSPSHGPSQLDIEDTIGQVSQMTGMPVSEIKSFVASYPPGSHVLKLPSEVKEHFLAFREARKNKGTAVRWIEKPDSEFSKITASTGKMRAKDLFLKTSAFLSQHQADIDQAFLDDFPIDETNHIAVSSFVIRVESSADPAELTQLLAKYLQHQ